jgi:hypothetical protein
MDNGQYKLFICEQNEYKNLVHVILDFTLVDSAQQSYQHRQRLEIHGRMSQRYLRQKMILVQKNRENVQSMSEINQSLKLLQAEHANVIS